MFLMMGMLWGAALAGIPIVMHLMHRQRTTPVEWGAMQFLTQTPVKMRRRKWIDNWLLLLIRMALIALLAVVLARPLMSTGAARAKTPMDVAIVFDHSLSTGRRVGGGAQGQTMFEQGIPVLEQVRDILPPGSTISVVLAEHQPQVLTPLPVATNTDIERVLAQLRQLKPGLTDASIPLAVQEARKLLVGAGRNARKMIVIVSDDQRSGWFVDNPTPWRAALGDRASGHDKDLAVYAVSPRISESSTPNVSVGGLKVQPGMLTLNRPCQIAFTVTNHGPGQSASFPVDVIVNGRTISTQTIGQLKAGDSQTLSLPHAFGEPGSHYVRVVAQTEDALKADNTAVTAASVVPQVSVLIVDGQRTAGTRGFRAAAFLDDALSAAGTAKAKVIGTDDAAAVNIEPYSVVVLSDVPRLSDEFLSRITEHVQRGNGLWIILGSRTEAAWVNGTLAKTPLFPTRMKDRATASQGAGTIEIRSPDNPAVDMLAQADRNAFAGTAVTSWWQLDTLPAEVTTVLEVNADGASHPLAIEHSVGSVGGRVVIWTAAADRSSGTLAVAANFVPLVNETAFHLSSGLNRASDFQLVQGQPISWTSPPGVNFSAARVLRPDGAEKDAAVRSLLDRSQATYADTGLPGIYELRIQNPMYPAPFYYGVAIEAGELESRTVSASEFESLKESRFLNDHVTPEVFSAANAVFETEVPGIDMARWFALGVLALLVFETYMTRRAAALQAGTDARELLQQHA